MKKRAARLLWLRTPEQVNRDEVRIRVLKQFLPPDGTGAEIGVYKGHFTRYLIDVLQPAKLYLLDPWYLIGLEWSFGLPDRSTINALRSILKRFSKELASGRVVLNIGWDLDLLAAMPDATFDWVYLDTTHDSEQTLKELRLLKAKVKPDGIISGDDWRSDPDHRHHGVYVAVQQFVREEPYEILYGSDDDQQWLIRRAR